MTLVLTLPLALTLRDRVATDLGPSATADALLTGWDETWATEFSSRATGLARTLTHTIIGFGGTLSIASGIADQTPLPPALRAVLTLQFVLWLFLWGGILNRYAGIRRGGPMGFFQACGAFAFRFFRLAVPAAFAWWLLLEWLHPWLFETIYPWWIRDTTSEWSILIIRVAGYALVFGPVAIVAIVVDLARVRTVLEDRRSMLGAVMAALRFVRRRPGGVLALVALNMVTLGVILAAWALMAPGPGASTAGALVVTEAYLLARVWNRLALSASFVAFVAAEFPAAGPSALAPDPIWPDAPAATTDELL